ncbi:MULTISPECIES: ABC transporter substrate-binding protein [unclassified Streptomyces]|uniref:ABC transporter substrate-binding protein n=1 Tax=unclassified Streptomyces TaxID=2593676 RepID=UPI0019089DBF|nr:MULTISPECIES: extracellular solute-binding protein [unclassified Streptomyces]MCU4749762.1 extracellular solute-binding protein [Streptomyces sp. G-5]QQN76071.1 extracellular solute-binding protein [Streptomyces sp. XC 2026]
MRRPITMPHRAPYRARAALAAGTALLAVAACGVGADPVLHPELSEEEVTISFAWWGAGARTQATMEAIELFEADHPNITVEAVYSDWNGYWDRMATATAAGDMADVVQFDQLYLSSYAERGALLDLSTVDNILDPSALPDAVLDSGRVGDTLYAVPTGATTNGVAVNTTLFERYGVDLPDTDTWTWEDLEEASVALGQASGGEVSGVSPFGVDAFTLTVWARQHGAQLFDSDGQLALPTDVLAGYWQRVLDLIDSGAAPSVARISEKIGLPLDQTSLVTGETAMAFIPAGQFSSYRAAAPDFDFTLVNWPADAQTPQGFQYLKPSMYWAGASTSSHPAEAALLIDFLTNDVRVAEIFGLDRGEPGNPAFREAVQPTLDAGGQEALAFTEAMSGEVGDTPPITPNGASDIEVILTRYYQQVIFGETSPEEAAASFLGELGDSIRAAG